MKDKHANTEQRVIKIVADILNSKPTDWSAKRIPGTPPQQFMTVFHCLYDQGLDVQNCVKVESRDSINPDPEGDGCAEADELYIGIPGSVPENYIVRLGGETLRNWASQT